MGDNEIVRIGNGISWGSGGGGCISTVDASIIWAKMSPTTDPPASVNGDDGRAVSPAYINGESGRTILLSNVCATTIINA